ncbi:MAG TPA: hypothetical protein G4N92_00630 [Anaerolineae bacterium]|nr:hypothetical protein [Anaerolineae bacterium]
MGNAICSSRELLSVWHSPVSLCHSSYVTYSYIPVLFLSTVKAARKNASPIRPCVAGGLVPGSPYAVLPIVVSLYQAGASLAVGVIALVVSRFL